MHFIRERMHAAGINPAIVEVEQRADRDGIVNSFVVPSHGIERLHVFGGDLG